MLTRSQKAAYAKRLAQDNFAVCPRCQSEDLGADNYEGDTELTSTVTCGACNLTWIETYQFVKAHDFYDGTRQ